MHSSTDPAAHSFGQPALMRRLFVVIGIALLLRIVWAMLIPVVPESDGHVYDLLARNLLNHGVFGWTKDEPFAFWPPGTSLFYAAVYRVAGFDHLNVVVANLALTVGMLVCTARVAARFFGARVALWSVAVLAAWPTLIMLTTMLVSEQLFLFLTMAALDAWTAPRGGPLARGLGAGVLLGAASLVRPFALLLPLVFAASMLLHAGWQREKLLPQLRLVVLSFVAMGCVIAPWTWRNYQLFGEFVLISTNGGVTLWMGNVPGSDGRFVDLPAMVKGMNDYQTNKVLGALAKQYIVDDPAGFVWRSMRKLVLLYINESIGANWNSGGITLAFGAEAVTWFKRFTQVTWVVIFALAAAGTVLLARSQGLWRTLVSPFFVTMAYFSVVHAVVITGERYHLVAATQIAVLGGVALVHWLQRRETRRAATPTPHAAPAREQES